MKILLVDDSKHFRILVRAFISKTLKHVELIEYEIESLGKPDSNYQWSNYDVLLLDYNLGDGEDGLDWLQEFGQNHGFPPTIILTGEGDEYIAIKAIKLGAVDYINKIDITPNVLATAINEAIALSPAIIAEQKDDISSARKLIENISRKNDAILKEQSKNIGYKIVKKIGEGAMSKVYLAERKEDNLSLVLKVLDIKNSAEDVAVERFALEAKLIEELDTPFVVKIHEHGLTENYGFIAMEFFSRGDIKQRMEMNISPELASIYMMHIAYGLHEIHKVDIVHRDLKPGNIMFRGDDSLALADFGISKKLNSESSLTTAGQIMGTPIYMSPEQGQGLSVDNRSDLYSAGVIFYELLTKQKPFTGNSPMSLIYQHVHNDVPRLPEKLSRFQEVIDNLMAKNPDDRYSSANELIEALASLE